jgi:hypothetical protein
LALSDEVEVGIEPTRELQVVHTELLVVGLVQPILQLFESVLLFLEQSDVELAQLLFKIELQVALEEQVHALSGHLLKNVGPLEEEEHFPGVEGVVLVNVVDVVGEFTGIFVVGNMFFEQELSRALGETATATLLDDFLLSGPVGSVG